MRLEAMAPKAAALAKTTSTCRRRIRTAAFKPRPSSPHPSYPPMMTIRDSSADSCSYGNVLAIQASICCPDRSATSSAQSNPRFLFEGGLWRGSRASTRGMCYVVRRAGVPEVTRACGLAHPPPQQCCRTSARTRADWQRRAGRWAGRPPKAGTQQLNEALVLRVVTEFQGFVRDLLDMATIRIIRGAGCAPQYQPQLIAASTRDRMIDRGNPHLDAIVSDASRLGLAQLRNLLNAHNGHHADDVLALKNLVEMRNALAHDNQDKLLALSRSGLRPTLGYVRSTQVVLSRHARALDRVVWDHLVGLFPAADPWSP